MNIAGKMKSTVGKSILIGAFIALLLGQRTDGASRVSAACTRRMRPSEMPSWSAWISAPDERGQLRRVRRARTASSAPPGGTRRRASRRASASNSSISGPSMCSVSFETAPSKPRPASTLTASRSSASGKLRRAISLLPALARCETTSSGAMKPSAPSSRRRSKKAITADRRAEQRCRAEARRAGRDALGRQERRSARSLRHPGGDHELVDDDSSARRFGLRRSTSARARSTNGAEHALFGSVAFRRPDETRTSAVCRCGAR